MPYTLYLSESCHFCKQFLNLAGNDGINMKAWFDVVYIDRYLRNEVVERGQGPGLDPRVTSVPTIIDPRTNHVYRGTDAFLVVQYISKTIRDDPHTRTFNEKGTNDPNSKMFQNGGGRGRGGGGRWWWWWL